MVGANAYRKQSDNLYSPYYSIPVPNIHTYRGDVPEPIWALEKSREVYARNRSTPPAASRCRRACT